MKPMEPRERISSKVDIALPDFEKIARAREGKVPKPAYQSEFFWMLGHNGAFVEVIDLTNAGRSTRRQQQ